jgi:hypothetical protein
MTETQDATGKEGEVIKPGEISLQERAAKINRKHYRAARTTQIAVVRWIALGHELVAAKKQVRAELGHGKWMDWLEANTDVSLRTAEKAVEFAKHETQLNESLQEENRNVANLSIRQASRIVSEIKKAESGNGSGGDDNDGGGDGDPGGDGDGANGDGANGNGDHDEDDPEEDGPDDKQFDALQEAYEEASAAARDRFHQYLGKIHGLEVRLVETPQQEQPDDGAVTAAVKTSEAEPHAAEAAS